MKKISVVLALALLLIAASSCDAGRVRSTMQITSVSGAGTKTITCDVLKDETDIPEYPGSPVTNNMVYFPQGMEAARALLQANAPEGFTIALSEEADKYVFTITYDFSSIADYNAKTKLLIGSSRWSENGLSDATFTTETTQSGTTAVFTENPQVLTLSVAWAGNVLINDTTGVYNKDAVDGVAVTAETIFQTFQTDITVGDTTETFDKDAIDVSVTGHFAAAATPTSAASSNDSPSTGDSGNTAAFLALVAIALPASAWGLASRRRRVR